jgi:hypothetical protein
VNASSKRRRPWTAAAAAGFLVVACVSEEAPPSEDIGEAKQAIGLGDAVTLPFKWTFSSTSSSALDRNDGIVGYVNTSLHLNCTVCLSLYYVKKEKGFGATSHDFIGGRFEITCPWDKAPTYEYGAYGLTESDDGNYFEGELSKAAPNQARFLGRTCDPGKVKEAIDSLMRFTGSWEDYMSNGPYALCRMIASPVPGLGRPCAKAAVEIETALQPTLAPASSPCNYDTSTSSGRWFQNCCQSCLNARSSGFDAYYNPIIPNRCTCF